MLIMENTMEVANMRKTKELMNHVLKSQLQREKHQANAVIRLRILEGMSLK